MKQSNVGIERIIAKIDNDFNPDTSDWIPRVAAWTIDALGMIDAIQTIRKQRKLRVVERIAYSDCNINDNNLKVYDSNGCEVPKTEKGLSQSCTSTGCLKQSDITGSAKTTELTKTLSISKSEAAKALDYSVFIETTKNSEVPSHAVINGKIGDYNNDRNYVIIDSNKLELNFDDTYVIIESEEVQTCKSEIYNCELPVIPNNNLLFEYLVSWCMYKMLCRGYKHPVLNLRDNNAATNPYFAYMYFKDKAKTSLISDAQKDFDSDIWRSSFYIDTFNPRKR